MIIFLTGPTGAGKTDTGWSLLSLRDGMVLLDCDWFASCSGFRWQDREDVASVYRALRSQLAFHIAEDRSDFIITLTLEMAMTFEQEIVAFEEFTLPIHAFRLRADTGILNQRISERGRPQRAKEQADAIAQQAMFDSHFSGDAIFKRIEASAGSDAIAQVIMRTIGG